MLTDSAISLPCFLQPRSFAALMTLYESNYIRLRALVPELILLGKDAGAMVSNVPGDVPLHLSLRERSRYTTTLHLTYFFEDGVARVPDPDLYVRIYQDARMAEALACNPQRRHPTLMPFETERGTELERRWSRNMMLNKWLEYCADRGHRLVASLRPHDASITAAL
jgi:uncharacterized protein YqiB (DUF1249 family)